MRGEKGDGVSRDVKMVYRRPALALRAVDSRRAGEATRATGLDINGECARFAWERTMGRNGARRNAGRRRCESRQIWSYRRIVFRVKCLPL